LPEPRRIGVASVNTAEYSRQRGRFAEARTLAEQALALADQLQDVPLRLYASHYLGLACQALGDYRRAAELLRAVVQAPRIEWRPGVAGGTLSGSWEGHQAINLAWLARCLADLGEFHERGDAGRQAVGLTERLNPYSLGAAGVGLGCHSLLSGEL